LESSGNSCVDYLNDTVLTTSKVDKGNQTTTSQVGKGDQMSICSNPVKASWKTSSLSLGAQTLSQTVSPPIVGAELPLASLPDALNLPGFREHEAPLPINSNKSTELAQDNSEIHHFFCLSWFDFFTELTLHTHSKLPGT